MYNRVHPKVGPRLLITSPLKTENLLFSWHSEIPVMVPLFNLFYLSSSALIL
jgi:hypothetical protein